MAELDQLTVATRRFIGARARTLVDGLFQGDPLLAYAKENVDETYTGGRLIPENFLYGTVPSGAYAKGEALNITQPQIEQQTQFNIKYFYASVTLFKEEVQVENVGEAAIFRLIDSRTTAAYMTIGEDMGIALYLNGQNAGYTKNFNGLAEAINDNSTASWDGNTYATYGTITRGGAVGTALNSTPTNVNGAISYARLESTYGDATFGPIEPNLGVTTQLGFSYIKNHFQTQQRFQNIQDPKIGFNGMQFNNATLMRSRLAPGTFISGTNYQVAVDYLTNSSGGAVVAYPTVTAESLWWINARRPYMNFYMSPDPEYSLGFTGFVPAQGTTMVVGKVLAACAVTWFPRYHQQLYGITG